jgi:hypothetical protein
MMRRILGMLAATVAIITMSACDLGTDTPNGTRNRTAFPYGATTGPSFAGLDESRLPACAGAVASWTISTTRTIQNCKFTGTRITVTAPNVHLKNMVILGNAPYIIHSQSTGLLVENSIVGPKPGASPTGGEGQPCSASIGDRNYTLRRTELFGCADGAKVRGTVGILDSYIHDMYRGCANGDCTHNDSVQYIENTSLVRLNVLRSALYGDPCTSNRHFQLKGAAGTAFNISNNFFYGLHGITNIDYTTGGNSGQVAYNTYAGTATQGSFSSKADGSSMSPGLYTGEGMAGITVTGNRFENGALAPTNGVARPYRCVAG